MEQNKLQLNCNGTGKEVSGERNKTNQKLEMFLSPTVVGQRDIEPPHYYVHRNSL